MPDAAFEETHRGFTSLVLSGAGNRDVQLRCYRIPSVSCGRDEFQVDSSVYRDVQELYREPPDALVVTGTEPTVRELTDERYWDALATLLDWAEATVPSTLLSCLAAHGALWALDQVRRVGLPAKCSGVYPQAVSSSHPLGRGLGTVAAFPHSRWNDVPGKSVWFAGYEIVVGSADGEWTVAARERAGRMLVLVQGHPEYAPTVLLREYRRDLRRFLAGSVPAPPQIPVGYLDEPGEELLRAWSLSMERLDPEGRYAALFDNVTGHIVPRWSDAAVRFFANWLSDAASRASGRLIVGRARA